MGEAKRAEIVTVTEKYVLQHPTLSLLCPPNLIYVQKLLQGVQRAWICAPALPLPSPMPLHTSPNFSEPQFPLL